MPDLEVDVIATRYEESPSGPRLFIIARQARGLALSVAFKDSLVAIVVGGATAQKWKGKLTEGDFIIARSARPSGSSYQHGLWIIPSYHAADFDYVFPRDEKPQPLVVHSVEAPLNWSPSPAPGDPGAARQRIRERIKELGLSRPLEGVSQ
jgi:hypothetical protein